MINNSVAVLMSTYNGEKYIQEQIESIINQDYQGNITILIRDDGSSDYTVDRIKNIVIPSNRKICLDEANNLGPQKSFLKLIKDAPQANYYFFADQDDVWNQNKISKAVSYMQKYQDIPVCYCSDYSLCNEKLRYEREHTIEKEPIFSPLKIIFYNQIPGCTMGFNDSLMRILKDVHISNVMMHDSMVLSLCAACGKIVFDRQSMIKHRIHGDNVVGEGHKKIIWNKWIVEKIELLIKKDDYDLSEMAEQFLKVSNVKKEYINDLVLLRDYKKSWIKTLKLLSHPDSKDKWYDRTTMSIRCKILFHIF